MKNKGYKQMMSLLAGALAFSDPKSRGLLINDYPNHKTMIGEKTQEELDFHSKARKINKGCKLWEFETPNGIVKIIALNKKNAIRKFKNLSK